MGSGVSCSLVAAASTAPTTLTYNATGLRPGREYTVWFVYGPIESSLASVAVTADDTGSIEATAEALSPTTYIAAVFGGTSDRHLLKNALCQAALALG
jgi:hypothetical protein